MCRYAYSYHSSCGHSEGVVAEYCEKAVPAGAPRRPRRSASLQQHLSEEMPALPLFPLGGFRQWMGGNTAQTTTTAAQSVRRREEGIRGTDESENLHDNETVLQHITESSRNPEDHHVGTDGRRMTSHGSTTAASDAEGPPKPAELDAIEAEIDGIKADIQNMRAEAETQHQTNRPFTMNRHSDLPLRAEATKIPAPVFSQHATEVSSSRREGTTTRSGKSAASAGTAKPSQSSVSAGKAKATATRRGLASHQTTRSKASPVSDSSATQRGSPRGIRSNTQPPYYDAVEFQHGTPSSNKSSPHFAQPTQAATHRVDQTLRKNTSPAKSSEETSPGRSIRAKAPDFETDKRAAQRQQKRTSLPQSWIPPDFDYSDVEYWETRLFYPAVHTPSDSDRERDMELNPGGWRSDREVLASDLKAEEKQSPKGATLQKKTSSYMSPTKSAQNRSVATIGQASPKQISPRIKAPGLRVNTNLAKSNDGAVLSTSPLRSGRDTGSDDVFFSPRSHLSSNASFPLKVGASQRPTTPLGAERPSSAMKLPMPLPHVENTVVTRQEPDHNLLDPIKEKLGREDLLRRDSMQDETSSIRRGSHSDILKPVFARLNRSRAAPHAGDIIDRVIIVADTDAATGSSSQMFSLSDGSRQSRQPRVGDSNNEPISRLVTGLRGQSSANIGKALAGRQQGVSDTSDTNVAEDLHAGDPAILYQGRKPSGVVASLPKDPAILYQGRKPSANSELSSDPAILYQGWKPSANSELQLDPAIIFSSGPVNPQDVFSTLETGRSLQPSSLRATAMNFVPTCETEVMPQSEPFPSMAERQRDVLWPAGLSLFGEDQVESIGHGHLGRIQEKSRPGAYSTWHGPSTQTSPQEPMFAPQPYTSFHCDLLHGDFSSRDPSISPTSDDTSPPWSGSQSQRNSAHWQISGKGRRRYLWSGGDGLEISFKGIGPDAEHDPNSPVVYSNYRENTKTLHLDAASYPRSHVAGSPVPPNAPKLMREYAEKMGLSHVPCADEGWQGKYDSVPAIVPLAGLCSCCKEGAHMLHRIGGGIDLPAVR